MTDHLRPTWNRFNDDKNSVRRFRKEDEPLISSRDMSDEEVTAYTDEKLKKCGEQQDSVIGAS